MALEISEPQHMWRRGQIFNLAESSDVGGMQRWETTFSG